ncbi:hypothetical protein, partial [Mediterraneibacter faecis]|uniref:hypothetical protein n=1 Tax=Mediterraneibacter faecis TaxID=592978 RepID=UPI0022E3D14C
TIVRSLHIVSSLCCFVSIPLSTPYKKKTGQLLSDLKKIIAILDKIYTCPHYIADEKGKNCSIR